MLAKCHPKCFVCSLIRTGKSGDRPETHGLPACLRIRWLHEIIRHVIFFRFSGRCILHEREPVFCKSTRFGRPGRWQDLDSKRARIYSVVRIVIDKLELINPSCTDSVIDTRQG